MHFDIVHLAETHSTNDWLKQHGHGTMAVWCDYQTAGRGQGTNHWESERGQNLTFSLLIHPQRVAASGQFLISMAVSNAISSVLARLLECEVSIKWPNDIYVGDRKICGILIENQLAGSTIRDCIVGVGLNINQRHFASDAPNPVSMAQVAGHDFCREDVLRQILDSIDVETDAESIRSEYRKKLYRRSGFHAFEDNSGPFCAELAGVADNGLLTLRDTQGHERTYAFKEVRFCNHSRPGNDQHQRAARQQPTTNRKQNINF